MQIKPTQKAIEACIECINTGKSPTTTDFESIGVFDKKTQNVLKILIKSKTIEGFDMSDIDISYADYMLGEFVPDKSKIMAWTNNVKWPQNIIETINPEKMLNDAKYPIEMDDLHKKGFIGTNIGIAIIDQRLNREHPEYADRIKHYETVGIWPGNNTTSPDFHGSLVVGCAVGKTTGTAPGADVYYIASNNWVTQNKFISGTEKLTGTSLKAGHRKYFNQAIRRILEINKALPKNKKIRFLSCSWGGNKDDQFAEETLQLFSECERNGIMVIGVGFIRKNGTEHASCDKRFSMKDTDCIGIPINGKTTPYYTGGYCYTRYGGASSICPYLAGVYACACQGNELFFTRPNWQGELDEILKSTAIEHPVAGKMINPSGIRDQVSEIVKQMEMTITKQHSNQKQDLT